ncbi:HAD family phosphatase [Candidatus Micrarchaeota archaeon]|nr:HAD family phosphatase [Candidatus Micrarchaeota archaeon]
MAKAVIFDLDGVISDTEHIQAAAEADILNQHGFSFSPGDITRNYAGIPDKAIFADLLPRRGVPVQVIPELVDDKWRKVFAQTRKNLFAIPGAVELIYFCKQAGLKVGLASSSRIEFIEFVLNKLSIRHCFDAITSGEEVVHGKPSPDVFLLAAKKLGVEPEKCVVVEDSSHGVAAAKKAGMKCIHLTQSKSTAHIVISSLQQLDVEQIKAL